MNIKDNLHKVKESLPKNVTLVAVSKTKPIALLQEAYDAGQRIFGENKVQEMTNKYETMPKDIAWHMIGHLQRNKVKYLAPYVVLIHAVDNLKLAKEIDKQAQKHNRTIDCLLQIKIAQEETKFGWDKEQLISLLPEMLALENIRIVGLMGMASFTADETQVKKEFESLKNLFDTFKTSFFKNNDDFKVLSMGMSGDYQLAIACGSTMVRVGSAIFGQRNYHNQ